jgi:hypothetical protein
MAFLSMALNVHAGRRTNVVLGLVFTAGNIFHLLFEQLAEPSLHMAQPSAHQLLINLSTVVVAVLIVGYARRWPGQEAEN